VPTPIALLAGSDRLALRVLDACRCEGIAVPEQMAVIGVDRGGETCRLANCSTPALATALRRVGYSRENLDRESRVRFE